MILDIGAMHYHRAGIEAEKGVESSYDGNDLVAGLMHESWTVSAV